MKAFKFYQVNYMLAKKLSHGCLEHDVTILFQGTHRLHDHENQGGGYISGKNS